MLYILSLIIFIISGLISWSWIEPEGFGEAIIFVGVWAALVMFGYWILELIWKNLSK